MPLGFWMRQNDRATKRPCDKTTVDESPGIRINRGNYFDKLVEEQNPKKNEIIKNKP